MKFKQPFIFIGKKKRGRKALSPKIVLFVQKLYARGMTMREAAARSGIALGSVHKILSGNHPNQSQSLDQIKREESLMLYAKVRRKYRALRKILPPLREINWMYMRGRFLHVYSIIAERINGVLQLTEAFAGQKNNVAV